MASTAEAVREVCDDAAEYFDPHDDEALAGLLARALADDGSWRAERIARGRARIVRFRWRDSAETLLDACTELQAVN
jgi:glycosyltransferase involved in cell wall biosynthesis